MRAGRQRWIPLFFSLVWLLFLIFPLVAFVESKPAAAILATGVFALAAFIGIYCWLWIRYHAQHYPQQPRLRPVVGGASLFAIALLLALDNWQIWGSLFVYVIAAFAGQLANWRHALATVVGITLLISGWAALEGAGIWTLAIAFEGLLVGGVVMSSAYMGRMNHALNEAREDMARLMVAEERLRFARDIHDLLGHSLSVIVLKAELAGKLVAASPRQAADEVADIERVARQALADVREAVSGYREASLDAEIEHACSALIAAGIDVNVERLDDPLPATTENVLGWALREGVTNVIRHAGASAASITIARHGGLAELELTDDGRGAADLQPGNGLTGIRERVARRNGKVEFGATATGGFSLRVSVPM